MATPSVARPSEVTRRLLPFASIVFLGYCAVGLPISTLPLFVHQTLGFGTTIVGVVMGLAPVATLLTRPVASRLAQRRGPRLCMMFGLVVTACSGLAYLAASAVSGLPALLFIIAGRIVLGVGDSLFTTAANTWMVTTVGPQHAGRAMSWAGIAMYSAIAFSAPMGAVLGAFGFPAVAVTIAVLPLLALPIAMLLRGSPAAFAHTATFASVIGAMWAPGLGLVLASGGFGTIAAFLALRYAAMGWDGAGLALSGFGIVYIASRLAFAGLPDRLGGVRVAVFCLVTEACGLCLIATARSELMALLGTALTGLGYSMVFPSLGVEVVRRVPPERRGAALGAFLACFDLGLGAAGPVMGVLAAGRGLPAAFYGAAIASLVSLGLVWVTRTRPHPRFSAHLRDRRP